jgi:hypothetical protein
MPLQLRQIFEGIGVEFACPDKAHEEITQIGTVRGFKNIAFFETVV